MYVCVRVCVNRSSPQIVNFMHDIAIDHQGGLTSGSLSYLRVYTPIFLVMAAFLALGLVCNALISRVRSNSTLDIKQMTVIRSGASLCMLARRGDIDNDQPVPVSREDA
jgi:hypothetical protein